MRPLPPACAHQFGVFAARQAYGAGWTAAALTWAVRTGRLVRLMPGVYVRAEVLAGDRIEDRRRHLVVRACASFLAVPASIPSHRTAAAMALLPLLSTPARACLTVAPGHTGDAEQVHLHRASLSSPGHVVRAPAQVPRTSVARTIVDVARESGVDEAVVVGDAALHRRLTTVSKLHVVLADCARWPGIRRAHEALARLNGLSESPLESVSRLRLLESPLPAPRLQPDLVDAAGRWLARTDFLWDEVGVVGEADGMEKYDDPAGMSLRQEKLRQELLERAGLIVVRWGWADLAEPAALVARIRAAIVRGARRPTADRGWRISEPTPLS